MKNFIFLFLVILAAPLIFSYCGESRKKNSDDAPPIKGIATYRDNIENSPEKNSHGKNSNGLPYFSADDLTPLWLADPKQDSSTRLKQIAPIRWYNHHGLETNEELFQNKVTIVSFFFSSCDGICPIMLKHLRVFEKEFINDKIVQLVSISIDPKRDTVEKLRQYAKDNQIQKKNWHLMTGNPQTILEFARQVFGADTQVDLRAKAPEEFLHSDNIYLVDKKKFIRGIYRGKSKASTETLIKDIKSL